MTDVVRGLVMAAGKGTRMKSDLPKPMHEAAGRSMINWVLDSLDQAGVHESVVVVGYKGEELAAHVTQTRPGAAINFVTQHRQLGTGDAAAVGLTGLEDALDDDVHVLVCAGDMPLLTPETLSGLIDRHVENAAVCTVLSAELEDPTGYGRIIRDPRGSVEKVVEEADATPEQKAVREVNTSIYCFRQSALAPALRQVTPANAQGEYYLTDVIEVFRNAGYDVGVFEGDALEATGVNDRLHLAFVDGVLRHRINEKLLLDGVSMPDPTAVYVDATATVGADSTLLPGTSLKGATVVESGCVIGPNSTLIDTWVKSGSNVPHAHATGGTIEPDHGDIKI